MFECTLTTHGVLYRFEGETYDKVLEAMAPTVKEMWLRGKPFTLSHVTSSTPVSWRYLNGYIYGLD